MVSSKLEVKVGSVSFSGEGDPVWLTEQLDKVLAKVSPEGVTTVALMQAGSGDGSPAAGVVSGFTTSLANYIREKGGGNSQVDRFLITADWLRLRGVSQLSTALVSKALTDNHQKRLANPADCLIKNVTKGYCEKADGGFYITPDGLDRLARGDG